MNTVLGYLASRNKELRNTLSVYLFRTAKTLYRKFETNIPRNETAWPYSLYLIHVSVSDFYIYMQQN
jgi:hypothetical protein